MFDDISNLSLDWFSWLLALVSVVLAGMSIAIGIAGWRMNCDDDFDIDPR